MPTPLQDIPRPLALHVERAVRSLPASRAGKNRLRRRFAEAGFRVYCQALTDGSDQPAAIEKTTGTLGTVEELRSEAKRKLGFGDALLRRCEKFLPLHGWEPTVLKMTAFFTVLGWLVAIPALFFAARFLRVAVWSDALRILNASLLLGIPVFLWTFLGTVAATYGIYGSPRSILRIVTHNVFLFCCLFASGIVFMNQPTPPKKIAMFALTATIGCFGLSLGFGALMRREVAEFEACRVWEELPVSR